MVQASRRGRPRNEQIRDQVAALVLENRPATVRQIYYLGIGRYWEKDTNGDRSAYNKVCRLIGEMREEGRIPWGWIADNTRWVRQQQMFSDVDSAFERWAGTYRRDRWQSQYDHVEVWCESDSIAGVINPITRPLGIGLYVCRGQSSKTFVYEAVETYRSLPEDKQCVVVLYVGDHDCSGIAIPRSIEERIARYGDDELPEVYFKRVAVRPDDVAGGTLQTHAINRKDTNYRRFTEYCRENGLNPDVAIEVEALPPAVLRDRLRNEIESYIDDDAWVAEAAAEESEQEILRRIMERDFVTAAELLEELEVEDDE